jgi:hypothetical protein
MAGAQRVMSWIDAECPERGAASEREGRDGARWRGAEGGKGLD